MRALLLLLAAATFLHAAEISVSLTPEPNRKAAPGFVLADATGKSVPLTSFRGKPLLLDLWAVTCGGCIKEIPAFIDIHHTYADKGLAVVGLSMDCLLYTSDAADE